MDNEIIVDEIEIVDVSRFSRKHTLLELAGMSLENLER